MLCRGYLAKLRDYVDYVFGLCAKGVEQRAKLLRSRTVTTQLKSSSVSSSLDWPSSPSSVGFMLLRY